MLEDFPAAEERTLHIEKEAWTLFPGKPMINDAKILDKSHNYVINTLTPFIISFLKTINRSSFLEWNSWLDRRGLRRQHVGPSEREKNI